MTDKIVYPGIDRLKHAAGRIATVGATTSAQVAVSILDDLNSAYQAGLDFDSTIESARLFTKLVESAVSGRRTGPACGPEECRVWDRLLVSASATWIPLVGMLPIDDSIAALRAVDMLFAAAVSTHLDESVLNAGFAHVRQTRFPASATAAALARRLSSMGAVDRRLVELVGFVRQNAMFPQEAAVASSLSSRLEFQFTETLQKRTGAEAEALIQLRTADEAVTDTFGSDCFVGLEDEGSREVTDLLTGRVLAVKREWNIRDPFANSYVEYILGRIEAGSGSLENAARVFFQLARDGFAPLDSTLYLAGVRTGMGTPVPARQAIESFVERFAVGPDMPEIFELVFSAYRKAGGNRTGLESRFPLERLVSGCRDTRVRLESDYAASAVDERRSAVDAFWASKLAVLVNGAASVLRPEDFDDAAASKGIKDRTVRINHEIPVKACLDGIPGISPLGRHVFAEAAGNGVSARELVRQTMDLAPLLPEGEKTLARLLPAWSLSESTAVSRLNDAISRNSMADVENILEQYPGLPGVPSDLLAALYEMAAGAVGRTAFREKLIDIGVRYWKSVRGNASNRIARTLRPMAFSVLNDRSREGSWLSAIGALFDTIPDDQTRKAVCDWYLSLLNPAHDRGRLPDAAILNAGRVIASRIGEPFSETVRDHLREIVTAGGRGLEAAMSADEAAAAIELIYEWCSADPRTDRYVDAWYEQWVAETGPDAINTPEDMVDAACLAAARMVDSASRKSIASKALKIVRAAVADCGKDKDCTDRLMARAEILSAWIPEASDLISIHREQQKDSKLLFYAAVLGAGAIVAIALIILYAVMD